MLLSSALTNEPHIIKTRGPKIILVPGIDKALNPNIMKLKNNSISFFFLPKFYHAIRTNQEQTCFYIIYFFFK